MATETLMLVVYVWLGLLVVAHVVHYLELLMPRPERADTIAGRIAAPVWRLTGRLYGHDGR